MATETISDNLSTFTRRAILAGVPVVITVAAIPAYPANTPPGPDGELLALIDRWRLVNGEYLQLSDYPPHGPQPAPAMLQTIEALGIEAADLWAKIMATRATTPQGMLAKLDTYGEAFAEPECASVYDDLRVLCGLEPSATVEG